MLERTWQYEAKKLFRAEKLYTAKNYLSFLDTFRKDFSRYIYFCPYRSKELISAPLDSIERVYVPRDCLENLTKIKNPDKLQKMALDFLSLISSESGVKIRDFGIHGSIALNMHTPESDIDFVVYGSQNFRRVEKTIEELVEAKVLSYIIGNRLDAARRFKGRYQGKTFMYNATRQPKEINGKHGDFRYKTVSPVKFEASIRADGETMFRPAFYPIGDYKPIDHTSEFAKSKIPRIVISNIGCYRNIGRIGDKIMVSGILEQVEEVETGNIRYQVVVGTASIGEEYIWLK